MVRFPQCGSPAVIKTSWTQFNPGRHFYCCSKRGPNHGIIDWYDPTMCDRAVQIIPGLLRNMNESQDIVAENCGTIRRDIQPIDIDGILDGQNPNDGIWWFIS
ncbi:zinc finger, GRF-type [Artemisia annua]|uniref:Zinc finger, GRF-type n=1 Tax=Artemisia annua TaxID=35608 RepID=A0A2U1L3S8_ARTAN|nr:zinc finger, GRF-type [Artemisia annua]